MSYWYNGFKLSIKSKSKKHFANFWEIFFKYFFHHRGGGNIHLKDWQAVIKCKSTLYKVSKNEKLKIFKVWSLWTHMKISLFYKRLKLSVNFVYFCTLEGSIPVSHSWGLGNVDNCKISVSRHFYHPPFCCYSESSDLRTPGWKLRVRPAGS